MGDRHCAIWPRKLFSFGQGSLPTYAHSHVDSQSQQATNHAACTRLDPAHCRCRPSTDCRLHRLLTFALFFTTCIFFVHAKTQQYFNLRSKVCHRIQRPRLRLIKYSNMDDYTTFRVIITAHAYKQLFFSFGGRLQSTRIWPPWVGMYWDSRTGASLVKVAMPQESENKSNLAN